jgi:hypothetical protein
MADPIADEVKADVPTLAAKALAYVKAHATPTVVGTAGGFVVGKFGLIGLLFKVL